MQHDKKLHLIAGFLLSLLGFFWFPLVVLGFIAGPVKEIYDMSHEGDCDPKDMIATWLGAAIAFLLIASWKVGR